MNKFNLNIDKILDKKFKFDFKGYDSEEVDEFLDLVANDYKTYNSEINSLKDMIKTLNSNIEKSQLNIVKLNNMIQIKDENIKMLENKIKDKK